MIFVFKCDSFLLEFVNTISQPRITSQGSTSYTNFFDIPIYSLIPTLRVQIISFQDVPCLISFNATSRSLPLRGSIPILISSTCQYAQEVIFVGTTSNSNVTLQPKVLVTGARVLQAQQQYNVNSELQPVGQFMLHSRGGAVGDNVTVTFAVQGAVDGSYTLLGQTMVLFVAASTKNQIVDASMTSIVTATGLNVTLQCTQPGMLLWTLHDQQ